MPTDGEGLCLAAVPNELHGAASSTADLDDLDDDSLDFQLML